MHYQSHLFKTVLGIGFTPVHNVVASGKDADLCYMSGQDVVRDPEYWLVSKDNPISESPIIARFSPLGMVMEIIEYEPDKTQTILSRPNAYGVYHAGKGIDVPGTIDRLYAYVNSFDLADYQDLFGWDSQRLEARFKDFRKLVKGKIIPDYEDPLIVIMAADGCPFKCSYCSESLNDKIELYDFDKIRDNIKLARELVEKYHGGRLHLFDQGFLEATDILWFYLNGKDIRPLIKDDLLGSFPYMRKRSAFVGTPTVNKIAQNDKAYLYDLFRYLNRALIGIETTHEEYSYLLGKMFSTEEKLHAVETVLKSPLEKLKIIVQVGFGKGLKSEDGTVILSEDAVRKTAQDLSKFLGLNRDKLRVTIEISEYQQIPGTEFVLNQAGLVVPYEDRDEEVELEKKIFEDIGAKVGHGREQVRGGYQFALPIFQKADSV